MSDIVVSLEGALLSQNHSDELFSEQNKEEEVDDNESKNGHMSDTVQSDDTLYRGSIPSPTTHVHDSENMVQNKKESKGKLSKAFQWSLRFFTKREKKDNDSSSRHSLDSDNAHLRTRHFTAAEILAATDNFCTRLKLGESDFGTMYRGLIDHGTLDVVIKCTKLLNGEELLTSRAVIEAQSQLHHPNILSLIGYCTDEGRLMLVYKYMVNRSLHDHLYREGIAGSPLQWTKRLEICIGVAKGLQYLHYGTANKIIHRNIKPSNILLDENWVAKISSFDYSPVTTKVPGHGYLDPDFYHSSLTEKSDVYAFGVVLVEVVSGRKPYKGSVEDELLRFRTCILENNIDQIVDEYLIGRISRECLISYLRIAWFCVLGWGERQPTMNSVVESLEIALELQKSWYNEKSSPKYLNLRYRERPSIESDMNNSSRYLNKMYRGDPFLFK